ncbi:MAG: metallo-beta-lactamase class B [Sphingobacteriales bacterium]
MKYWHLKGFQPILLNPSFLKTVSFGKDSCNGMVVLNNGVVVVFDTPANPEASSELINVINQKLNSKITGLIPTHFHADGIGGISSFSEINVPIFISSRTLEILEFQCII